MKLFSAIYDTGMIRFLCQVPIEHNSVADFRSSEIYLFFCIEMFFYPPELDIVQGLAKNTSLKKVKH